MNDELANGISCGLALVHAPSMQHEVTKWARENDT